MFKKTPKTFSGHPRKPNAKKERSLIRVASEEALSTWKLHDSLPFFSAHDEALLLSYSSSPVQQSATRYRSYSMSQDWKNIISICMCILDMFSIVTRSILWWEKLSPRWSQRMSFLLEWFTQTEDDAYSTTAKGGGALMVWAAFSAHRKINIVGMRGCQTYTTYIKVIVEHMAPFPNENMPVSWIYQQDKWPVHVCGTSKQWFDENFVRLMKWLGRSPNFNSIENFWNLCGILTKRVHRGWNQFVMCAQAE